MQLTKETCNDIQVATVGQSSDSLWHEQRRKRIAASIIGEIGRWFKLGMANLIRISVIWIENYPISVNYIMDNPDGGYPDTIASVIRVWPSLVQTPSRPVILIEVFPGFPQSYQGECWHYTLITDQGPLHFRVIVVCECVRKATARSYRTSISLVKLSPAMIKMHLAMADTVTDLPLGRTE